MSSSRVFLDTDVPATQAYLAWLGTQDTELATIDASQVTKVETVTIDELQDYLRTQAAQQLSTAATIDQLKLDNGWYYIGCGDCNTKLTKSASTLVCHKCENENAIGVIKFCIEYSVHDKESETTFVFLDEAGGHLIGRKAAELIDEYIEGDGDTVETQDFPPPECLSEVLSETHMFEVKISEYNFRATRQTFTISRLIKPEGASDRETDILYEAGESASTEANGNNSTNNEDTGGNVNENQGGYAYEVTTEQTPQESKRPKLGP